VAVVEGAVGGGFGRVHGVAWRDTTCLFTRILEGHAEPEDDDLAVERARGLVLIGPAMFARQLTTFRGHPAAVVRFGWMFGRSLAKVYWNRPRPRLAA